MKKIVVALCIVGILLLGSVSALADPYVVPPVSKTVYGSH